MSLFGIQCYHPKLLFNKSDKEIINELIISINHCQMFAECEVTFVLPAIT